jgi:hypothetical protein
MRITAKKQTLSPRELRRATSLRHEAPIIRLIILDGTLINGISTFLLKIKSIRRNKFRVTYLNFDLSSVVIPLTSNGGTKIADFVDILRRK